ncbi:glycerophosphodiester phosphodiesterase family protein [Bosea sp. (in: a-proteobacteria)]|jgi:glycerophosphoryl diester phosphodiesterase|uniref:glycerophosphodiester phosphodiesterase family protein n=1 Tax=Bosea sp. (in: a-proteobacteria) TaxID=1871050 RepID=UPI003F70897B
MLRFARYALLLIAALAGIAFVNNSAIFGEPQGGRPVLLAHRGLAQTYPPDGVTDTTCTAARINPPEHPYLENTLPAIEAAFAAGADIVEFDIHPTSDGHFAVFHDWTLDCRTNGTGVTRERSLAELKALDIGHGYTADGGATYPFRGRGTGLMPTLDEVLARFPDRRFLIHIKSNDPREGEALAARLLKLAPEQLARLMVYGGDQPIAALRARVPSLLTMSKEAEKRCLLHHLALGWIGIAPRSCEQQLLLIPSNYTAWIWGWPQRFTERMRKAGSSVIVAGPLVGGEGSTGIDRAEDLAALARPIPGIWTNRIDRIAPLVRAKPTAR